MGSNCLPLSHDGSFKFKISTSSQPLNQWNSEKYEESVKQINKDEEKIQTKNNDTKIIRQKSDDQKS